MSETKYHPITKIAEDIYQVRLPLPFALNHINVYLLRGKNGWTIIDTGINWEEARQVWQLAFDELKFSFVDVEQIVLTHMHPDHFGLAGWFYQSAQAQGHQIPIRTSPRENAILEKVWRPRMALPFSDWLQANGMPEAMASTVHNSMGDTFSMTLPHPPALAVLDYGVEVALGERLFKTIHAPGHSDGQIILYDESDKLLLSGDHVLMKITPNIGLWEHSQNNPLKEFMGSLSDLEDLEVRQALPGHRRVIEDWAGRIEELLVHHENRLGLALEAVERCCQTPYEVANHIFETDRFSPHEWRFAIAETLAHLEYLRQEGQITQAEDAIVFELA